MSITITKPQTLKPFSKRGRPYSFKTQLAKEFLQENPHIKPVTLMKQTKKLGINIKKSYARVLKWRYGKTKKRKKYNYNNTPKAIIYLNHNPNTPTRKLATKLKITYNHAKLLIHRYKHNKLTNNNHNNKQTTNKLTKQQKQYTIVNVKTKKILDLIDWYIPLKEAQKQLYPHYYKEQFTNNPFNRYNYRIRYGANPILTTLNIKGDVRNPIQQLRNYQIPVDLNHVHHHNKKRQYIDYHIHSHDLCRFLSNYLGLPHGSSIYLGKTHYIATDMSGLDICHYHCFEHLLYRSLEGYEGEELLRRCFLSGKLVFRNKTIFEWGDKN